MIYFAGFICCAVIIFFSGKRLSYYGEIIADLTGMGKAWVGLILLASVTSLPELIVGISASAIVQSADLAVGNILGSCAFNLGILSIMDAFVPKNKPLLSSAAQSHILPAAFGLILMAMVGMGLILPEEIILIPTIGIFSFLFIIVYFLSVKVIYQFNKRSPVPDTGTQPLMVNERIDLKKAGLLYAMYGIIIIITALFLPQFAEKIAESTGLGQTFVGTLFLAASTVLPEIAVTVAAIRSGAIDLAVGNLLGSNLFNIFYFIY
jgi:cation:H+ antiporter